ncbi:IS21 family transposase [Variovorax sp. YR752]|uniref:IS21 family transposase n=1 Tax=Variovorax sp. YR752 TaxID=1884383 RepID=UPI0031380B01
MAMMGKIRSMHFRQGKSISEIARLTSLSRNTIKKWLKAPQAAEPKYRRREMPTKLAPFVEALDKALKADGHSPRRERRTARALHVELQALGYDGGYTRLTDYIRAWRDEQGKVSATSAFVPLSFELGDAFQFDWSEEGLVIGGIYRRVQLAHLKLCASRAFWLVAYPTQGHEMLFDAHTRSFAALGGIPRRGIYDNMKTAVDKVKKGKGRVVNARFAAMTAHYLFDPDFCTVASGWEKGRVEKNVQDSRRRVWIEAARQRFGSFDELNAWLAERCRALWQEIRHPEHGQFSVAEMLEHELPQLMPMPEPFDGYVENPARVSSTCLVTVLRNRYSVPCELAGHMVSARLYPTRAVVVAEDKIVARHARLSDRGQTSYDWQHYIPLVQRKPGVLRNGAPFADMPAPLLALQQALLRRPGGDRVMAQVLAAVPTAGLDAVLVAAELVLETGAVSAEHVLNVLGRLNASPPPDQVETVLRLNEAPRADTDRYDRLRDPDVQDVGQEVRHA